MHLFIRFWSFFFYINNSQFGIEFFSFIIYSFISYINFFFPSGSVPSGLINNQHAAYTLTINVQKIKKLSCPAHFTCSPLQAALCPPVLDMNKSLAVFLSMLCALKHDQMVRKSARMMYYARRHAASPPIFP